MSPTLHPHFSNIDQISILLQKFILFTHIEDFYLQIFICYKSSFCSPIMKLSIFKYSFVTKVQYVHPYQNLHFWYWLNSILLQKFNLFTGIKTYIFVILIKFLFCYKSSFCSPILKLSIFKYSSVTKVQFVHPYQNLHFWYIDRISILLQKFILFTRIVAFYLKYSFVTKVQFVHPYQNLHFWNIEQILFCYKSSFCSSILKISILKYSFVTKVLYVHLY